MKINHLRDLIAVVLESFQLPCSEALIRLLVMIAAHESGGFRYVRQINGPALGLLQMEPATFNDTLRYIREQQHRFPDLLDEVNTDPEAMVFSTDLALLMARVYLLRFSEPLPEADDIIGLAAYAKKYWNTAAGKATTGDYAKAYRRYCA